MIRMLNANKSLIKKIRTLQMEMNTLLETEQLNSKAAYELSLELDKLIVKLHEQLLTSGKK